MVKRVVFWGCKRTVFPDSQIVEDVVGTDRVFYSIISSDILVRVIAQLSEMFSRSELAATYKRRPSALAELRRRTWS